MRTAHLRIGTAALVGAALWCLPGVARATLGGNAATISANEQHLGAKRTVQPLATSGSGQRHELRLPSGAVVHEYLSAKGTVYAISWRGLQSPNLSELLGTYFAQLSTPAAQAARHRNGHHHVALNSSDLVVQASGHNHHFSGRAWVRSLLPAGVSPETFIEAGK